MKCNRRVVLQLLVVLGFLFAGPGVSADAGVAVFGAWSRALPPVVKIGAAYLQVTNTKPVDIVLVGAEASIAERAELHEHVHVNGMMRMRQLQNVQIAAGSTVRFAPHGLHIMLFGLRRPLNDGADYELTLRFASGERTTLVVTVRREAP
jgi:hypothetical protein